MARQLNPRASAFDGLPETVTPLVSAALQAVYEKKLPQREAYAALKSDLLERGLSEHEVPSFSAFGRLAVRKSPIALPNGMLMGTKKERLRLAEILRFLATELER